MYRLRCYRMAFTRNGASNKGGVGKTNYFPAKCVNITHQMALTAAAFYDSLISRHFSCFDKKKQVGYNYRVGQKTGATLFYNL